MIAAEWQASIQSVLSLLGDAVYPCVVLSKNVKNGTTT
jgi:hypothetical protein